MAIPPVSQPGDGIAGHAAPLRYLSRRDAESLGVTVRDLMDSVRAALIDKSTNPLTQAPPKLGIRPRAETALHAAAGFLASQDLAGIKWISRYPDNPASGLDVCAGLCIVNDAATGVPTAVLDASWITEARTAAASAIALLAARPAGVSDLALLGFGAQGRAHLRALSEAIPGLRSVRIASLHPDRTRTQLAGLGFGLEVTVADTPGHALRGADAVVSLLPMRQPAAPTFDDRLLAPGAVIVTVDFDAAWQPTIFKHASAFVVDDADQYRAFRQQGWFRGFPADPIDIAEVLVARRRLPCDELVVMAMMGLGIEDVAIACLMAQRAATYGVGRLLDR